VVAVVVAEVTTAVLVVLLLPFVLLNPTSVTLELRKDKPLLWQITLLASFLWTGVIGIETK
jgi:hypothetical protein